MWSLQLMIRLYHYHHNIVNMLDCVQTWLFFSLPAEDIISLPPPVKQGNTFYQKGFPTWGKWDNEVAIPLIFALMFLWF